MPIGSRTRVQSSGSTPSAFQLSANRLLYLNQPSSPKLLISVHTSQRLRCRPEPTGPMPSAMP